MTKSDYIFYCRLKKKLQDALISRNFVVSTSISAGGGSKSVTYVGEDRIAEELEKVEARLASFTGGGASIKYPVWR